MATYYHAASDLQAEGLQRLYLMNPGFVGYSDEQMPAPAAGNVIFSHSTVNSLHHPGAVTQCNPQHQRLVGVPVQAMNPVQPQRDPRSPKPETVSLPGFSHRLHPGLWCPADLENGAGAHHLFQTSPDMASELGVQRSPSVQQGLSLSLSSQHPSYTGYLPEISPPVPAISPGGGDDVRISESRTSNAGVSNVEFHVAPLSSKYLRPAQELLEEVANAGREITDERMKGERVSFRGSKEIPSEPFGREMNDRRCLELTSSERQELQIKKSKLVRMMEEVEQRYRQYHHEMQLVISSFEAVAGPGSAKMYTDLALRTISKQFRCLRDAIFGQIRAVSRELREDDGLSGKAVGSRLKLVDQHLRQQKALQQLGMMQQNAWRPQRGLPERSVSVLRAWLFEHFLHPYPKDSDKIMLAKQTGLTRSQVSNWFINARVRLWKPMVEEMYTEEMRDQGQIDSNEKTSKSDVTGGSKSPNGTRPEQSCKLDGDMNACPSAGSGGRNPSCFLVMESPELRRTVPETEMMVQGGTKRPRMELQSAVTIPLMGDEGVMRADTNGHDMGLRDGRSGYSMMAAPASFAGYPIGDIGRFDLEQFAPRFAGNGVSLTLGLPHCENVSLSGSHQSFITNQNLQLGRRLGTGNEADDFCSVDATSAPFHSLDLQSRKPFSAQLLPDFVA